MICIDAPAPQVAALFVNGERVNNVFRVRALWNDGPGIVWYHPHDTRGAFYLSIQKDWTIAEAFRFARHIKVVFDNERNSAV